MSDNDWQKYIVYTDNGIFFQGTTIRPLAIFKLFLAGHTSSEINVIYPSLLPEQINICKSYAKVVADIELSLR